MIAFIASHMQKGVLLFGSNLQQFVIDTLTAATFQTGLVKMWSKPKKMSLLRNCTAVICAPKIVSKV